VAANGAFGLDVGIYGALATPEVILRLAGLAEAEGFSSLWLADHVMLPAAYASRYPYSAAGDAPLDFSLPLLEPVAVLGALAGATKRVKLGTAVLVAPYRNPVLLARMLATLDHFSGGRVVLGVGAGWLAEEFAILGAPDFAARGAVTDEYLDIFKKLCAGGKVTHEGRHYRFEEAWSNPGSLQRPHPPVLIGGVSDAALRRVARLGDGWLAVSAGPGQLAERLRALDGFCAERGRSRADLALAYKMFVSLGEAKRNPAGEREPGTGSPAQVIDDLKAILGLGFGTVIVRHRAASADELFAAVDRFATEIAPKA
jgi:probable F420-dependent oxidoreductase